MDPGNVGDVTALPALNRARQSGDPLAAELVARGIGRLESRINRPATARNQVLA